MNAKEVKEKLDYCFRVDNYCVADPDDFNADGSHVIYNIDEFYMVCGKHSLLKVTDLMHIGVFIFDQYFQIDFDEYDFQSIPEINEIRKVIMVYDYCLTKLRKMGKEKGVNSYLNEIKCEIENYFCDEEAEFDLDVDPYNKLPKDVIYKLEKRCEYLAYAYDLEWRGVISLETCDNFKEVEALKEYVDKNGLVEHGEGRDKTIRKCAIGKVEEDGDLLRYIRPFKPEMFRYRFKVDFEEADEKLIEEQTKRVQEHRHDAEKVVELLNKKNDLEMKMAFASKQRQLDRLNKKHDKVENEFLKNRSQIVFMTEK